MPKTSVIQLRQRLKDIADELIYECGTALLTKIKDTYKIKHNLEVGEQYILKTLEEKGYELDCNIDGGSWYARLDEISPKMVDR